jgi:hypothetical protein
MRKFGNLLPSDPSRNLTVHGFLRQQKEASAGKSKSFSRPSRTMNLRLEGGVLTDLDGQEDG